MTRTALCALTSALALSPLTARAQFAERLSLTLEGGAGTQLTAPQSSEYGFGYAGSARVAVRIAGPVALQGFAGYWSWGSNDAQLARGVLTGFGGGLRIAPRIGSAGRFVLDADVGFSASGSDDPATGTVRTSALLVGGGVGWLFPVASVLSLGPSAHVHYLKSLADVSGGDRDRAIFWTLGLSISLHGSASQAPRRREHEVEEGAIGTAAAPRMHAREDTDNDGIVDAIDRCVAQPETRNGYLDDDGCPDVPPDPNDPDHDMVTGAADRCADQPEDFDGFQDEDGCPEPDNDNDGVLDASDQCPDQVETRNNFQDDDGCADTNPNAGAYFEGTALRLTQPLAIADDRPGEGAAALLAAVAEQLAAHPEVRRLRIECRTDAGGSDAENTDRSDACARNVLRALRRAGVNKRRLQALGAGSLHAATGAANTRVDFVVVDPAAGVSASPAAPAPAAEAGGDEAPRGRHGRHGGRRRRRH